MSRYRLSTHTIRFSVLALLLTVSAACFAKENSKFSSVHIKNFGQMDDRFYRGGQPDQEDYKGLAALGIKTVIDLQDDSKPYEKTAVEALGMRYINIPIPDKGYPKAEQVNAFLKLFNDPNTGKFFVHCAGGRHRTGIMGAVYRFNHDGWDYDRAYAEMKQYDFYSSWGHGSQKQFVQDYWQQFQTQKGVSATAASTTLK